jgi:hypothetical protein
MNRHLRHLFPAALIGVLVIAGCGTESTELPPGLGPVAVVSEVEWPASCDTGAATVAYNISDARQVLANPSYYERQARGCVPFAIADIWQALQIPTGIDVAFWPENTASECEPRANVEPGYAVSFITKEIPKGGAIVQAQSFDITWRIDVTGGTTAAPTEVKMLYGKTAGTTLVPWIRGSVVFTQDPVHPGTTRLEIVRQLNTSGYSDDPSELQRWLVAFFEGVNTQLSTGALLPRYCTL